MPKRFDDYLPNETRREYVNRRKSSNKKRSGNPYWYSSLYVGGKKMRVQGTLARPGTREFRFFDEYPQYNGHSDAMRGMFDV